MILTNFPWGGTTMGFTSIVVGVGLLVTLTNRGM